MPIRTLALAFAVGVLACNGPMGLLPGGELSGEDRPIPSSWSFAGTSGQAQLETHPEDPYSVYITYTIVDGRLYINAADTETEWAKNIADGVAPAPALEAVAEAPLAQAAASAAAPSAKAQAAASEAVPAAKATRTRCGHRFLILSF